MKSKQALENEQDNRPAPNPQDLIQAINSITPAVVSAGENSTIRADDGLIFGNFAEHFVRIHGDLKDKFELTRNMLVVEAYKLFHGNKLNSLKKQCLQAEHFENWAKQKNEHNPTYSESLCKVYNLTAGCIINNAVSSIDYAEAREYLIKCQELIHKIETDHLGYKVSNEIKNSIQSKLSVIKKHL